MEIEREYREIRARNREIADANLSRAMKNKYFAEVQNAIKALNFQIAKHEFYEGDIHAAEEEKTAREKLLLKRSRLLEEMGIKEEDLTVKFDCPDCKDTGYIEGRPCKCFEEKRRKHMLINLGIRSLPLLTFDDDTAQKPEFLTKLYEKMKKYVEYFPGGNTQNFIFTGMTGCGKTYLASIVAGEILHKGFDAIMVTATELNQTFLKMQRFMPSDRPDYLGILIDCDFLVIDDLGSEILYSNITLDNFYTLISARHAKNMHTFITTNLNETELGERYGDRFFSRIADKRNSAIIRFPEEDLRLKSKT